MAVTQPSQINVSSTVSSVGLKNISEQFREDLLKINLQTPPDIVVGLTDLGGSALYQAYRDAEGKDAAIHRYAVNDPGNVLDLAKDFREYLMKRNLPLPSDMVDDILALSASQSETLHNLGDIGTDAAINWRAVVTDAGTVDGAAYATRMANLSRNKPRDLTDPSESNLTVIGDGYNYSSLLEDIGQPAIVNNFIIPNFQSVGAPDNPISQEAFKLDVKINKYAPEQYNMAQIREEILNEVYKRTTYVTDYTTTLNKYNNNEYNYFGFYNQNNQGSIDTILNGQVNLLAEDTPLMNIAAYMLNYNLQQRFEQNLYTETLGRINLVNQNFQSQFPPTLDPLELIKIAKDPMDNIWEKNFTITVPRNFVSKAAQFILGLEGVVSPFDLWESVDLRKDDLTPSCEVTNEGIQALNSLDPTAETITNAKANVKKTTKREDKKINDDYLLGKTGGGQRWALYENLNMNKYSPKFDTPAELLGFTKKPKGIYYLGSETSPPIELLQVGPAFNLINNNALAQAFNAGFDDPKLGGYGKTDMFWANESDGVADPAINLFISSQIADKKSTAFKFRGCSILDITQKLLDMGGLDSPIRNLKTKFRDGDMVYSKGNAVRKIEVTNLPDGNAYKVLDPWEDGFCRTWTKGHQYRNISNLVRYGELIRRERNSVIDRNANYNIFPTALNVGTLYDQQMLGQDGVRDRFADKNFDQIRARKYMFSIENLAWKDSDEFNNLPPYEQGSNGGRVMWFPPYGLTFNETSTANWTKHDFLGRPEPIYTYNNTERTGTLSWMVVVDHPTILNLLVQKELAKYSDEDVDNILASFFAGCLDYDIFELARIWGVFSNDDLAFFKGVIDGDYPYPLNVTWEKKTTWNETKSTETKPIGDDGKGKEIKTTLEDLIMFFPNDMPYVSMGDKSVYGVDIYPQYKSWLYGGAQKSSDKLCDYDYVNTIGVNAPVPYFLTGTTVGVDIEAEYTKCTAALQKVKDYLAVMPDDKQLDIQVVAFASTLAPEEYNKELAKRRGMSVANWFAKELGLTVIANTQNTTEFDVVLKGGQKNREYIRMHGNYKDFRGKEIGEMYKDVQWGSGDDGFDNTKPIIWAGNVAGITGYDKSVFTSPACKDAHYSILSYPACYARRVKLIAEVPTIEKTETKTTVTQVPNTTLNPVLYQAKVVEKNNVVNKRDIATRILNKLIGENEYFEYLSENSPVVFDSLRDKLKYFSPAFHSTTPEGLNARLTFLQQCVRPGNTLKIDNSSEYNVVNMSFGKPPVCVLRIGDFFNTKMMIESLTIDYNVVGNSITLDLNPEGIGAQPMIAKITASVKYVGGAGLREPVARLQNALSFNYYANADIYETRSFGQTDTDERYLENLELAYNSAELDIAQLDWERYSKITVQPNNSFTFLGTIVQTYPQIGLTDPAYIADHRVQAGVDIVQYYEMNYQPLFQKTYQSYRDYMTAYTGMLGLSAQSVDFMWLLYSGFVGSPNFGQRKADTYFDPARYPYIAANSGLRYLGSNYFVIDSDAFQKSDNKAVTKLHLYPQKNNRIQDVSTYTIQDFGGVAVPRLMDIDYMKRYMQPYKEQYDKYLDCEEWLLFTDDIRKAFDAMGLMSQNWFRRFAHIEFDAYYTDMWTTYLTDIDTNFNLFNNFYGNVLATNAICSGVDGGISEALIKYLEVVPNVNTQPTADYKTIFGTSYDVLNEYAYPLNTTSKETFKNMATKPSNDGANGSFNYLRDQLSSSKWQPAHLHYYDFTAGKWMLDSSPVTNISGSTVFEKLNYERLFFGNLTVKSFIEDTFAATIKEFAVKKQTKSFASYSDARKYWIRLALGLPSTDEIYKRNVFNYTGSTNSVFALPQNIASLQNVSLEDLFFYQFVWNFRSADTLARLKEDLYSNYPDPNNTYDKGQRTLIDIFIKKIKAATAPTYDTLKALKVYMKEAAKLATQTQTGVKAVLDTVAKGAASADGYTLKMFEVQDNRANAAGRNAIQQYVKFLTDYPQGL